MASITKTNIYCVSVLVQGVQCPAQRRGQVCRMAHTMEEVNPRKCNREECRCKYRKYPFVCQFIHDDETKEEYSIRVGFDPNHTKYNGYSLVEIKKEVEFCGEVIDELKGKISKFDSAREIPEKDKAYVRRTQNSIHHLSLKIKWLSAIEQNDNRTLEEQKKKKNRKFVIDKYERGKYVSVDRTFEKENDEDEFNSYREDMLRDSTFGDDWDGDMDIESYIEKCWIGLVIDNWYDEEEAESKNMKKKPEPKDTSELIEEILKNCHRPDGTYSDLPLPTVFSTKPSPLQLKDPW